METTHAKDSGEVFPGCCLLGVHWACGWGFTHAVIVAVVGSACARGAAWEHASQIDVLPVSVFFFWSSGWDLADGPGERIIYADVAGRRLPIAADPAPIFGYRWPWSPGGTHAAAPMHSDAAGSGDDDDCELLPPHVIPPGGAGDPPALDMFNQYAQSILGDDMQVLFVHQLAAANGARPIVVVEAGVEAGTTTTPEFEILLIEPASWSTLPRLRGRRRLPGFEIGLVSGAATFYAGQLDAADAFHLVVEQGQGTGSRRILITGKLAADGKSVKLARGS